MATITTTSDQDPPESRRPTRRRWIVPGVIATVALTAAAGWALRHDAEQAAAFDCRADGVVTILPNDGTSPLEACAAAWQRGQMVEGVTAAPPLVACVTGAGTVSVIQGSAASDCRAAGMEIWDGAAEYSEVGGILEAVRLALYDQGVATGDLCITAAAWRDALEREFDSADVAWTISARPAVEGRRCYDVGDVHLRSRDVNLVAVPGDESIVCDPRGTC